MKAIQYRVVFPLNMFESCLESHLFSYCIEIIFISVLLIDVFKTATRCLWDIIVEVQDIIVNPCIKYIVYLKDHVFLI